MSKTDNRFDAFDAQCSKQVYKIVKKFWNRKELQELKIQEPLPIYRAKTIESGCTQWVCGHLTVNKYDGKADLCDWYKDWQTNTNSGREEYDYPIEVDPSTICKYIGRLDGGLRRIFSGDVILYDLKTQEGIGREVETRREIAVVSFDSKSTGYFPFATYSNCTMSNIRVCGNIFDNPELIEEEVWADFKRE